MEVGEHVGVLERDPMTKPRPGLRKRSSPKILSPFQKCKIDCFAGLILVIIVLILVIIGLAAALIVAWASDKSAPCEDDWIWHRGKCYYFSTERDTWNNSEKFCHSHKSSLATIDNKEELDFVFRLRGSENHWIGIRRIYAGTGWMWSNGTSYNGSLFRITRLTKNSGINEFAFLNHDGVKSQEGIYEHRWICTRR